MLRELVIKDLAIIDRLDISFGPGLTCLTGETGAGKSILVDAISLALGGRAQANMTRQGGEAIVEASFDVSGLPELKARLTEAGLDGGDELIVKRVLSGSGRGKVYMNSSLASLALLQEAGDMLVDLHGQHEHQSLLKVDSHIDLLDSYCSTGAQVEAYRAGYAELAGLKKRLDELTGRERERAQRMDLLNFQMRDIDEAGLAPSEEEQLYSERARLANADKLKSLALSALDGLKDAELPALALLDGAVKAVREIASVDAGQSECQRLLESARVAAGEACSCLRGYSDSLEADPERLDLVEGRLDLLARLKKKYGETIEDVLAYRETIEDEAASLEGSREEAEGLSARIKQSEAALTLKAGVLRDARMDGARGLARKVEAELDGLGMPKARFEAGFTALDSLGPKGMDRVEFLISANPGEPMKPLCKVASGGELSRVMLALKVILARADRVPTLIFDEVDSGVGGVTASAVGRKLKEAATGRQVLCITHLPQIASLASEHFTVEKKHDGGHTTVRVKRLDKDGRVTELARMLGGDEGTKTASAHAEELVRQGELNG